jgi:hypothetical protein
VISAYAKDQYSEYYPQEMGAEEIIYAEYGRNMLGVDPGKQGLGN